MKKWIYLLLSGLLLVSLSITPSAEAKNQKPFNPKDFSTYGLGLNKGLEDKNIKKYTPEKRFISKDEYQKQPASDRKKTNVLPAKVDLRQYFSPIRSQGRFGTCVAFATTGLREYYIGRNSSARGSEISYLSPLYIYYPKGPKDGMALDSAFRVMVRKGVTPETERPYDLDPENTAQFSAPLTPLQNKNAKPYQIEDYRMIWGSRMIDEIKQAVANGDPAMVGIDVYPNFDATPSSGIVPPVGEKKSRGGHALVVAGYDEENQWFILRNSWGNRFGDGGYVYMKYDILKEMDHGYALIAEPYANQTYPPQGVNVTDTSTLDTSVRFEVSAIDADSYELYRDDQLVKTFTGTQVSDENLEPGHHYTYHIVAKNRNGDTRSQPIQVETQTETLKLKKAG
ncbi:C1 family peptidase [Salinithrix halophila]|uniref:C1 family peptidase n=1 Tax=Salinithrix halophila TaxID=1485204 RepID=A0ABV8JIY2_9BACL